MPRWFFLAVTMLLVLIPVGAHAQQVPPPPIVIRGLEVLGTSGPSAALDEWLKGWPADAALRSQLLRFFEDVQAYAGKAKGYDYLGAAEWGSHTRRLYFTVLGENRPYYVRFDVYLAAGGWSVVNVTMDTDPARVFPPELFIPPRT